MSAAHVEQQRRKRTINALWLNHTSVMGGAEESMRAVLAQWHRDKRAEFRDIDAVASLPGDGPLAEALRGDGTGVVFAPLRRINRPNGLFEAVSLVSHVLQTAPFVARLIRQTNSDLVHSNSSTAHLIGGIAARRLGVPAIWHARDLALMGRASRFLASRASCVLAISHCVGAALQSQGVPEDKIRVVHNGIDAELWQPNPRAPRALRGKLNWQQEFVFGCVGQMVPWKRQRDFIRAAAQLAQDAGCDHARFVVIGGDQWNERPGYLDELRALANESGLGEKMRFIEFQSDNRDMIASLDCLVHAAIDEPLGRVLLESLALGVPTVAYARNGPLEIISHEHDGLLAEHNLANPDDPKPLAQMMRRVLLDENLRSHLSHNSPRTIAEKFPIAETARATAQIYRELV